MIRSTNPFLFAAVFAAAAIAPATARGQSEDLGPLLRGGLVKVLATTQSYDLDSPWNETSPRTTEQRGVVVRPGLVLTPAGGLTNHRMIEISVANSARRYPASLAHVDYSAGLALVKIDDPDLSAQMQPIPLGEPITIDDEFEIWQIGASDLLERNTGLVQKVYVSGVQLHLTVKTNLSDSGNGQVALKDGKIVGLVVQTRSSSQEGRIVTVETLRHYLDDFDSGEYRGFGAGGFFTQDLLRDDLRSYFQVPDDQHGIVVTHVIPDRTGDGVLKPGDVIVELAGHDLDDEGMYLDPIHGRLGWFRLIGGSTHPGDEVGAKVLRKGEPLEVKIPIRDAPLEKQLVPYALYDQRPPYLVVGGLVILELTRSVPARSYLIERYQQRSEWDPPDQRERIVYVSRVLSDESNRGMDELAASPIRSVNGRAIGKLADVIAALETPTGDFHVFEFEGIEKPYVIRAAELGAIDLRIGQRYRIPELRYLGEETAKKDE